MKRVILLLIIFIAAGTSVSIAQTRQIAGRVLDEKGQGVPSAGVTVKGTSVGTVTDFDGNFVLAVPEGSNTFVVQGIGYNIQEAGIANNVVIQLKSSATSLNETVVTALAIRREKRELGYSATTIGNTELTAGNNVSALSAIQGKTAGVNITSTTGGPGGSTRVVLRGEKSISGNNNALIVVDGVITNNSTRLTGSSSLEQIDFGNRGNDINPDDIESITVLKGPAAAALYGSEGANGAIMITTKSGRNRPKGPKKTEITFNTSFTVSEVLKLPDFQNSYGQGIANIPGLEQDPRENTSWGLPFDGKDRPWGQIINGKQLVKPYSAQPDNIKSFFNKGKTSENYLSLAGGTEKSTYFMSLSTLNNTGVIPSTYYDKYSVRFNGSTQLTNNFYSTINVNYLKINQRVEASGQAAGGVLQNLYQTPRDIPLYEAKDYNNPFYSMNITLPDGRQGYGYYNAYTNNPYWIADEFDNRIQTDRVLGSVTLGYKKGEHFDIFNRLGIDMATDRVTQKSPKYFSAPFDVENQGSTTYTGNFHTLKGGYFESSTTAFLLNNDVMATYRQNLSDDIGAEILVGNNIQMLNNKVISGEIDPKSNGLVVPGYYSLQNNQGPVAAVNTLTRRNKIGVYGSMKFNYRRSLFLEFTARNDWSSALAPGYRSYFYPSINASWVFTEGIKGDFITNVLNYGKLRAGWASVGNGGDAYVNNNPAYVSNTSSTTSTSLATGYGNTSFPFNGIPGFTQQNFIGDPTLLPERTNSWEVGLELSMLKNRFTVEATYYYNRSIDQIFNVPTAPSAGYTSRTVNLGEIENKGIELAARLTPVRTKSGFTWEIFGTYYKNVNKVLSLSNGVSQITIGGFSGVTIAAGVGQPYGALYAIDLQRDPNGRVIVDTIKGLPVATKTTVFKGTFQPRFIASWGTSFKYKGLTLSVLFDTKQGGVFYSQTKSQMDFTGTAPETANGGRDPRPWDNSVYADASGNYINNTKYNTTQFDYYTGPGQSISGPNILDASYVKLREASISWALPAKWFAHTVIGGGSIGLFGNNLLLWTAKENTFTDPEMNSGGSSNEQGFEFSSRPSLRNYGINVKVSF